MFTFLDKYKKLDIFAQQKRVQKRYRKPKHILFTFRFLIVSLITGLGLKTAARD